MILNDTKMAKTLDPKNEKCQEAMRLKYERESYPIIARKIKIPLATIKRWFAEDGLLKEDYEEYRGEENQKRRELADAILKKNIKMAADILVGLMGSDKDEIKFKAAMSILEREFGKAVQPLEGNLIYEQIIRKIEQEKEEEERSRKPRRNS